MASENDENKYEVFTYERDIDFVEDQKIFENIENLNKKNMKVVLFIQS